MIKQNSNHSYQTHGLWVVVSFLILISPAFAQRSNNAKTDNTDRRTSAQGGEIEMSFQDKPKNDPYDLTKRKILAKLQKFSHHLEQKNFSSPPLFSTEELTFLAAHQLYCTLKEGACTLVPFALYETDLVRGVSQEKPSCPNLVRFWKQWIAGDMEKRVGLKLGVVHYEKLNQFKSKVRPKLLRCSNTVTQMLALEDDSKQFLNKRYASGSKKSQLPKLLANYINEVNTRVPNIYTETGVRR